MMMVSDDCLVECKIDDDSEEENTGGDDQLKIPPPPPEFASKASTPGPKPPTPPTAATTPTPTPTPTPVPSPTQPVNRDPYGINKHLKVDVSDVLVEPSTPQSIELFWLISVAGFEKTRIWTYRCLSLLLAVPFALLCGVFLAILACLHVWFLVPCIQLSNTFIPCLRSLCLCSVNIFISPFCTSIALCCSQITILLTRRDWHPVRDREAV